MRRWFGRGRARAWWRSTPRTIRRVVWVSLPLGVAFVAVGVYGDGHGLWDNRSFLTNLASSFASLFFGVPLALVFLSHLTAMQENAVESRAAHALARRHVDDLLRALETTFPDRELADVRRDVTALVYELRDLTNLLRRLRTEAIDPDEISARYSSARAAYRAIAPQNWGRLTRQVSRSWSLLDGEARPAAQAADLYWMAPEVTLRVGAAVERVHAADVLIFLRSSSTARFRAHAQNPERLAATVSTLRVDVTKAWQWFEALDTVLGAAMFELSQLGALPADDPRAESIRTLGSTFLRLGPRPQAPQPATAPDA